MRVSIDRALILIEYPEPPAFHIHVWPDAKFAHPLPVTVMPIFRLAAIHGLARRRRLPRVPDAYKATLLRGKVASAMTSLTVTPGAFQSTCRLLPAKRANS
jgi:hypothetical protein